MNFFNMNLQDATREIKYMMYIQYMLLKYYKMAKIATKMQLFSRIYSKLSKYVNISVNSRREKTPPSRRGHHLLLGRGKGEVS